MRMSLGTLMRFILGVAVVLTLIQFVLPATGLIGLTYPVGVANQPLHHPTRVVAVAGARLTLADGRTLDLGDTVAGSLGFSETPSSVVAASGSLVDLETLDDGRTLVWVSHRGGFCGTSFAQPIRIPLIPIRRNVNSRMPLGWAMPGSGDQPGDGLSRH